MRLHLLAGVTLLSIAGWAAHAAEIRSVTGAAKSGNPFSCPTPAWPKEALRKEQSGSVSFTYMVDGEGRARELQLSQSSGFPLLDDAARDALIACRFQPDISATPRRVPIRFEWRLDNTPPGDLTALLSAANAGSLDAQKALAQRARTAEERLHWIELAALQGDAESQYRFGQMLQGGAGIAADPEEARLWVRKAAEQGWPAAENTLGVFYQRGVGMPADLVQAAAWYRKAAEHGNASGQLNLGDLLASGRGVARDDVAANEWFKKAADQQLPMAQVRLGFRLSHGIAMPRDAAGAVAQYRLAAAKGDAMAQNNLGYAYETGDGVARSYEEALRLYLLSASQGNAFAEEGLGGLYEHGWGVTPD